MGRVEQLEAQRQQSEVVQRQFRQELDRLVAVDAQSSTLGYTQFTPSLDVPPLVAAASPRTDTVVEIGRLVRAHAWTAIYGGAGLGNTRLAVLLAQYSGNCARRIGMRGLYAATAGDVLDHACRVLAGGLKPGPLRLAWYVDVCARLGQGTLLVLDDMPRLISGDPPCLRLILLARACSVHGVHILSTSAHRLPTSIGEALDRALLERDVPALTDSEAGEILKAHGAPDAVLQPNTVRFVNATARSNPTLLAAAARYLRDQEWQFNNKEFDALMRADYAEEVNADIRPADVLRGQLATLPYLLQWFVKARGIQERILLPYVLAVWSDRLERNHLSFRRPAAVEEGRTRAAQQADQMSARQTISTILWTIGNDLGIAFPLGLE